jgi:hypothetical protein
MPLCANARGRVRVELPPYDWHTKILGVWRGVSIACGSGRVANLHPPATAGDTDFGTLVYHLYSNKLGVRFKIIATVNPAYKKFIKPND